MKLIYLCGPVTGTEQVNIYFDDAEKRIYEAAKSNNIEIHISNPTRFCEPKLDWHKAMRSCIQRLMMCDGIALLQGWQNSIGANIELKLASDLHIPVVYIEPPVLPCRNLPDVFKLAPETARYCAERFEQFCNEGIEESLAENRAMVETANRYLDPYGFEYKENL